MDHLSTQMQRRLLGRALKRREMVAATQHLRECESCREDLIALRQRGPGSLLEQILPETRIGDHPSEDLLAAFVDNDIASEDHAFVEDHIAGCDVCGEALSDLNFFRSELQQMPSKQYLPAQETKTRSRSAQGSTKPFKHPAFFNWLHWFKEPFGFGFAIAAAACLILLAIVGVRISLPQRFPLQTASHTSTNRLAIVDGGRQVQFGLDGMIELGVVLPKVDLDALNRLCMCAFQNEPLQTAPALDALKSVAPTWRGQQSLRTTTVKLIRPVRTLIKPGHTMFQWTASRDAKSYTVHVIDDQTQEEVAASPPILPVANASISAWSVGSVKAPLLPGKRYRWYVAALVNDEEMDSPGIELPPAKFSVLSEGELAHLNELERASQGDLLLEGLLDLRSGLLDDAQDQFEGLLEDPNQTSAGKVFLRRLIEDIASLKE
jgi:predicted anti-sigma-YlaC factor YlaD